MYPALIRRRDPNYLIIYTIIYLSMYLRIYLCLCHTNNDSVYIPRQEQKVQQMTQQDNNTSSRQEGETARMNKDTYIHR